MAKKMTRKEALELMLEATREGFESDEMVEAREVVEKMIASIEKQAKRPKTPSKAAIENEKLADNLVGEMVGYGKPVDTKWITEHVQFILTTQKATAVCKVAMAKGDIVRVVDEKKHVWYHLPEQKLTVGAFHETPLIF